MICTSKGQAEAVAAAGAKKMGACTVCSGTRHHRASANGWRARDWYRAPTDEAQHLAEVPEEPRLSPAECLYKSNNVPGRLDSIYRGRCRFYVLSLTLSFTHTYRIGARC